VLSELAVSGLGVIDDLSLVLAPGMTAVTGETGAGKTLVVTAIELLVGGRADSTVVGPGRREAVVEGRFVVDGEETVLRRIVPAEGRSRAYVNGHLATVAELADVGTALVDLHGQHTHQSLLRASAQRDALDRFAGIDLAPLAAARTERAAIQDRLVALGGDEQARNRELDLLRYQLDELESAAIEAGEDERLDAEEAVLADADAHRTAADHGLLLLVGDDDVVGAHGLVGTARAALEGREPYDDIVSRLRAIDAELADVARDLANVRDTISLDPERLVQVRERLGRLHELRRKYGPSLDEVVAFRGSCRARLTELEAADGTAAELELERIELDERIRSLEAQVGRVRRAAAPALAAAATDHLVGLALAQATLCFAVADEDPGDAVEVLFTANPGSPPRPLRKVASGGELARVMLALRLVLTAGPETLVFDEVDAGIGGTVALSVGQSLAALGAEHQILVVTHLPQVAAFADAHLVVEKHADADHTATTVRAVDADERVVELSRMLSGSPTSAKAQGHARELLAMVSTARAR
jgi:DNA repair protein RecN (Recombination protein N)